MIINIIIGAGVTGLSFAHFNDSDSIIFEKEKEIGGYCRTIKRSGFIWDYSGHFFHFRHPDIKDWILEGIDCEVLTVEKKTSIYTNGRSIDFPFQANIHQLAYDDFLKCLSDLANPPQLEVKTFKDFILSRFGEKICEMFLIPYNEKLYATKLEMLDANAMGRFFPNPDLKQIISNFSGNKVGSYNNSFTYPRGGAIEYVNSIYKKLTNTKTKLDTEIVNIDPKSKIVEDKYGNVFEYDNLISTMPLPKLLDLINVEYEKSIYTSNKVFVFNLGFDSATELKDHWIYYPDTEIIFYRLGLYNNIFEEGPMSLYVEIGAKTTEKFTQSQLLKRVLEDLKKVGVIKDHKLVDSEFVVMDPAYVHVSELADKDKKVQKDMLEKMNIYSLGRYGDWKYCSIEDNIVEARDIAFKLNSG